MKTLFLLLLLISCSKDKQVTLIKQWHLSGQTPTSDIEKAKTLPQYENQVAIFNFLVEQKKQDHLDLIIAEGCEGEIDNEFSKRFNSWTIKDLMEASDKNFFKDIMAPVPMKMKAIYPDLKVSCGDSEKLIQENLSAASDMRGFFGFYQRLMENKGHSKKFKAYSDQVWKLFPRHKDIDALEFVRQRLVESISRFEKLVLERNDSFVSAIEQASYSDIFVVIGGLHVKDLKRKLENKGIKVSVYTPKGYRDDEQGLLDKMKNNFLKQKSYDLFLVPFGFQIEKFPLSNLIDEQMMTREKELLELKELAQQNEINIKIITSDYDRDGIRDFTFSTNNGRLILSPEDQDWDNDGIHNLQDASVGEFEVAKAFEKVPVANNYLSQSNISEVVSQLKKNLFLAHEEGYYHEFLVLELLQQLVSKKILPINNLKIVRSAAFKNTQGQNTFFNYVKVAKTLNYDPKKLNAFINDEYQKRFSDADFKTFINSYAIPLIIHSLAHEIGHSLDFDINDFARENGWSWTDAKVESLYLVRNREALKQLEAVKSKVKFRGRDFAEWMKKAQEKGFLQTNKIPSLYALTSPEEWFAEVYAMCKFLKLYKKSGTKKESERLEKLLGINPSSVSAEVCLNF